MANSVRITTKGTVDMIKENKNIPRRGGKRREEEEEETLAAWPGSSFGSRRAASAPRRSPSAPRRPAPRRPASPRLRRVEGEGLLENYLKLHANFENIEILFCYFNSIKWYSVPETHIQNIYKHTALSILNTQLYHSFSNFDIIFLGEIFIFLPV